MMKNTIKGTVIRLSRKGTIPTRYASNVVIYRLRVPNLKATALACAAALLYMSSCLTSRRTDARFPY